MRYCINIFKWYKTDKIELLKALSQHTILSIESKDTFTWSSSQEPTQQSTISFLYTFCTVIYVLLDSSKQKQKTPDKLALYLYL